MKVLGPLQHSMDATPAPLHVEACKGGAGGKLQGSLLEALPPDPQARCRLRT